MQIPHLGLEDEIERFNMFGSKKEKKKAKSKAMKQIFGNDAAAA